MDWIERLTGLSLDAGSGSLEIWYALTAIILTGVLIRGRAVTVWISKVIGAVHRFRRHNDSV